MILANMWFINVYYPMINSYTIVWVYHWNNQIYHGAKKGFIMAPQISPALDH